MNIEYFVQLLKNDIEAKRSFENYLLHLISESSKQFKTASSMEQVSKTQGKIEILELILRDFNKEHLQEREHATYESRFGKAGTNF